MTNGERPKRILFICHENCNRSQMAEAFARIFGANRVEAYSAGCCPAECIHAKAIAIRPQPSERSSVVITCSFSRPSQRQNRQTKA